MKKEYFKTRMITRFVDTAYELSLDIGFEKLTIRNIAEKAGYNSATIYNYFENFDHLIFFTAMRYIKEYADSLKICTASAENAMDIFMMVWECFCKHAFRNPKIYNAIFFHNLDKHFEDYVAEYYSIYPQDLYDENPRIGTMLLKSDITKRGMTTIEGCVDEGYIKEEDADRLNEITLILFEGMLRRVLRGRENPINAKNYTMDYIKFQVESLLIRDYKFHF